MPHRRCCKAGLAFFLAAFALISAAPSAASTVINFDDPQINPVKDPVVHQYHDQGVDFVRTPAATVAIVGAGVAPSGSRVLNIGGSANTSSNVVATFTSPARSVSLSIGSISGWLPGEFATLDVNDVNGQFLEDTFVNLPDPSSPGSHYVVLSVTRAQFDIGSISVFTSVPKDTAGIDDLTFDRPAVAVDVSGPGGVSGAGGISCPASCVGTYDSGTKLTLTAAASAGSVFVGWAGACSSFGRQADCVLTVATDLSVSASFRSPILNVALTGPPGGSVRSVPAGIDCGNSCAAAFAGDAQVVLTASTGAGSTFAGWTGACAGALLTCSLRVDGDTSVTANFGASFHPPPPLGPVIDGGTGTTLPPVFAPPQASLSVDVNGDGSVSSVAQKSGSQEALSRPGIACGSVAFVCFATAPPGARWTLRALAAEGQYFKHWTGACTGTQPTCVSSLVASETVGAVFAPRHKARAIAVTLDRPSFHVAWRRSVGGGTLVLSGRLARPALVRLQLRRPFGAPLLSELVTIGAGRFKRVMRLSPGLFSHGARLFPGGFIVVVSGTSAGYRLTRQLHTIVLAAPARGVARRAFASNSEAGKAVTAVPASGGQAWANFVFQTQPRRGQRITVAWFWPDGRLLGEIAKPNRPTVTSSLTSAAPLPTGSWRAELRVGGAVVSALRVALR